TAKPAAAARSALSGGDLPHGTVYYRDRGTGAPIVFLHGYLMGGSLWDLVVRQLDGEFRCVVPELPFGAHPAQLRPDADLTPAGVGRLVADFLNALDLSGVTLVGNDSGAAIAQVVAARHAGRLRGLALGNRDPFHNHPPPPLPPRITAPRPRCPTPPRRRLQGAPPPAR